MHALFSSFRWLPRLLVLLIVLGFYSQALRFEYIWDDTSLFVNSPALRLISSPAEFWHAINTPILPGTTYFRPLVLASFAAEFSIWGVSSSLSHGVNLVLFSTNIWLVGALTAKLVPGPNRPELSWVPAVVAMACYGLHPANTEAAVWAAGRFDLMVTTFGLAMLLADQSLTGTKRLISVSLLFFGACLCKEMALVLPMALVVLREIQQPSAESLVQRLIAWTTGERGATVLAILGTGAAYLILRWSAVPRFVHQDEGLAAALNPWTHVAYVGRATWFYAQAIILPFVELSPQHPLPATALNATHTIKGLVALLGATVLGVSALRLRTPKLVLAALTLASLAPVLHIIPLSIGNNIGHERFLTLPLAFAAVLVAWAVSSSFTTKWERLGLLGLGIWTLISTMNLLVTIPLWRSDRALWEWAYQQHPHSHTAQFNLLSARLGTREFDGIDRLIEQMRSHRQVGTAESFDPLALYLRILEGTIEIRQDRPRQGVKTIEESLELYELVMNPPALRANSLGDASEKDSRYDAWRMRYAYTSLAEGYLRMMEYPQSIANARKAIHQDPLYAPAHFNLALALYGANEWDSAEQARAEANRLYLEAGRVESARLRAQFLSQICNRSSRPDNTCSRWQLESGVQSPANPSTSNTVSSRASESD